ncbi:MAG: hypothetical protein IJM05_05575, partial [Bacteroidales bacterium]|nr:hypothetical protein [Bacteroidales bacterium]
ALFKDLAIVNSAIVCDFKGIENQIYAFLLILVIDFLVKDIMPPRTERTKKRRNRQGVIDDSTLQFISKLLTILPSM